MSWWEILYVRPLLGDKKNRFIMVWRLFPIQEFGFNSRYENRLQDFIYLSGI